MRVCAYVCACVCMCVCVCVCVPACEGEHKVLSSLFIPFVKILLHSFSF